MNIYLTKKSHNIQGHGFTKLLKYEINNTFFVTTQQ